MRVTINPIYVLGGQSARDDNLIYVRGGQSARDDINDVIHTQLLYIIDRSVIIVIIKVTRED